MIDFNKRVNDIAFCLSKKETVLHVTDILVMTAAIYFLNLN